MRGQDARGRERSISSDRLLTADVVKRAQRLLIGVQRLARCPFLGSMDSSVSLLALAVRALSRERVVAAVSSCLAIGNASPKPPTSGHLLPSTHRRQPPASRSPTRPPAAARSVSSAPPRSSASAANRQRPSQNRPRLPIQKPRSTSFRPAGHLQVSQRLQRSGHLDKRQQGQGGSTAAVVTSHYRT
jgi:hypothetical protein